MKNGVIPVVFVLSVLLMFFAGFACGEKPPAKDKIVIGQAASLSGLNAIIHNSGPAQTQQLWIEEVNAKGGIYVKEYDKKLPIELKLYDDKSDHGTMTRLIEKLILEDKVDFLFPPCGTSYLFAAAPIANKYKYILLGNEGGATSLEKLTDELRYFFPVLNYSNHYQIPLLADLFAEWGVKSVAITFNEDLHGIEYANEAGMQFELKGIRIVMLKSHPIGIKDMSQIIKAAKSSKADAFCSFSYPGETFLVTKQAIEIGYNPKVFQANVGVYMPMFGKMFGSGRMVEGVIGGGAWSPKQSPAIKKFYDKLLSKHGEGALDMWGNLYYYGAWQFFEKAIEEAGTLDQKKLRDIIASEKFDTILGPTWFDEKQRLARECHPGEYGQWQNGEWEVILPKDKATAKPIFPKPAWKK
ncbi:MAG: amino acid ABC transporter substrate-binding protein [Spirochaetes bacterium]|nr:amino acid ABC transporter substrate-binding protein [Spirochaetota bacterium]